MIRFYQNVLIYILREQTNDAIRGLEQLIKNHSRQVQFNLYRMVKSLDSIVNSYSIIQAQAWLAFLKAATLPLTDYSNRRTALIRAQGILGANSWLTSVFIQLVAASAKTNEQRKIGLRSLMLINAILEKKILRELAEMQISVHQIGF